MFVVYNCKPLGQFVFFSNELVKLEWVGKEHFFLPFKFLLAGQSEWHEID